MKNKTVKPIEVKKLENGSLAVRWSNSPKKWSIVTDPEVAALLVYIIIAK